MEKYNTQFTHIISLHQEEISENIFDLFKKIEAFKNGGMIPCRLFLS